jgi:hypothetical protein
MKRGSKEMAGPRSGWTVAAKRRGRFAAIAATVLVTTALLTGTTTTPASALVIGVCTIKANNPHASTHVSGTINAVGTVSCSVVMSEIYLAVHLEKATGGSWSSWPFYDSYNTKWASENAATSCGQGPGTFRSRVSYVLQAPPGANPAYSSGSIYSPWISVACGASLVAGGGAAQSASTTVPIELEPPAS